MDIYALLKYFGFRNWRKQADEIWVAFSSNILLSFGVTIHYSLFVYAFAVC